MEPRVSVQGQCLSMSPWERRDARVMPEQWQSTPGDAACPEPCPSTASGCHLPAVHCPGSPHQQHLPSFLSWGLRPGKNIPGTASPPAAQNKERSPGGIAPPVPPQCPQVPRGWCRPSLSPSSAGAAVGSRPQSGTRSPACPPRRGKSHSAERAVAEETLCGQIRSTRRDEEFCIP